MAASPAESADPAKATSYRYNGAGLRVGKWTAGSAPEADALDPAGLGNVILDNAGNEFVWGGGGLIGRQTSIGGNWTYAHADRQGSLRLLTNNAGAAVDRQQWDSFGKPKSQTGASLPFGYTGEWRDQESGLIYLRARYYDPSNGRFLSRDPVAGEPRYGYAHNSPTNMGDPTGFLPDDNEGASLQTPISNESRSCLDSCGRPGFWEPAFIKELRGEFEGKRGDLIALVPRSGPSPDIFGLNFGSLRVNWYELSGCGWGCVGSVTVRGIPAGPITVKTVFWYRDLDDDGVARLATPVNIPYSRTYNPRPDEVERIGPWRTSVEFLFFTPQFPIARDQYSHAPQYSDFSCSCVLTITANPIVINPINPGNLPR